MNGATPARGGHRASASKLPAALLALATALMLGACGGGLDSGTTQVGDEPSPSNATAGTDAQASNNPLLAAPEPDDQPKR